MMRYLLVVSLLVVLLGVVLWAGTAGTEEKADFTFIERGVIGTLDPAAMSWQQDIRMALTIWQGLCTYQPDTTAPTPGCAFAPEISADRRTYTFRIRPQARWNNGESVTSRDFLYAWRRAFEPGTAHEYAFFFNHIEGVQQYVAWRLEQIQRISGIKDHQQKRAARAAHLAEADRRFKETVGLEALDERTLRVRLSRPLPYFLELCAFSTFLPVHAASVERFKIISEEGLIYYDEQWVKPANTFYNGPFYLAEWKFKRHILLRKNPGYWDADAVKLNTLKELEVEDLNTAWLLYSGGDVDYLSYVETIYTPKLIASSCSPLPQAVNKGGGPRRDIHVVNAFGTYFYNFNCRSVLPDGRGNPFADPRVRRAFTMAVDKKALVEQVWRLGNPPATAFIPPGTIAGYPPVAGLPYDPPRAKQLLAEAGYPGGRGFPEVVILYNTGFRHDALAQAVLGMWEQVLGVPGRCMGKEGKTFAEDKQNTNFIICRASWYGDYGDPTTFLDMFRTGNGNNDSKYSDPHYDRLLDEAEQASTPPRRLALLAEAERHLVNEALPLLPVFYYVNVEAFDPHRIKNLFLTPRQMTMLHVVEVAR